jgi:S1-C subfamily serine protease
MSMTLAHAQTQTDCNNFISKATQLVLDSVVNISVETKTSKLFQKNTLISSGSGFFVEVAP